MIEEGARRTLVEARAGSTVTPRFFSGMRRMAVELEGAGFRVDRRLVYGGDDRQSRGATEVIPWNRLLGVDW